MQNLMKELKNILQKDDRFFKEDSLFKNVVIEYALKLDKDLLKMLYSNETIRKQFFIKVDDITVFDKDKFIRFVSNKEFLPDSFTSFKNKIGLMTGDKYFSEIKDVVLAWPYKDCVLEGGMTKEDQKRNEIFYNETLAPDDINRLFDPKVLTNLKRFDVKGEHVLKNTDKIDFVNENLIIKGNNLLALHSLKKRYAGKIKLICIDPPYNTGKDEFNYNDSFIHSTWLTFMKNRLEIAKELLDKNGTIFIFCDNTEQAYLRVLTDNIFSRNNYITTIVWRNSDNSNNDAKQFSQDHNYILVYSKNEKWESLKLDRTEENSEHYKNPDNDPRGPWFDGNPLNSPDFRKNLIYDIITPNGNIIKPPPNGWRWDKNTLEDKIKSGEIRFSEDNKRIIRRTYLNEIKNGLPPSTLWEFKEDNIWDNLLSTGHTRQAKSEQKKLFKHLDTRDLFKTPKPEKVIQRIIQISTFEKDIVLDFFAGCGTTGATAQKMKRNFIIIEQMDYIDTFLIPRIKNVIDGEQGGISKDVGWQGGGSFIYCELMQWNEIFVNKIQKAKTAKEIKTIWEEIKQKSFLSYKINIKTIEDNIYLFEELSIENQKTFLIEVLDKNSLYVNYSEINDKEYNVSDDDKKINNLFYNN